MNIKSFITSIVFLLFLCSCSSHDAKIREGLENSISIELIDGYELKEYMVRETILDVNLKDSINQYQNKVNVNRSNIQADSLRLKPILENMNDCKVQRLNTPYYIRSTYDRLIRDYEKMHDEILQDITEKEEENNVLKGKIENLRTILELTNSPIVYYKVKHIYDLNGMRKEEIVTLDYNYKYINTEQ